MSNTRRPRNLSQHSGQSSPKATQAVVVVVALLCVGAVIALALVLGGGGGSSKPAASGTSSPTTTASAPTSTTASTGAPTVAGLHCKAAPALPAKPTSFKSPPPKSLADKATWDATVATNCGDITVQLDGKAAPQTVASFLFLARKGFFDDSPCHRLTTSGLYVLQCGDPTGTGSGGPGYGFGIENAPKSGSFPAGTVAMARATSPNSNGSQFFVVYKDTSLPTQGGGYSIFGKVTKGLGIVKALARAGVAAGGSSQTDGAPAQPISILGVTVKKA
jgi:peptidyl-prolyl cis-trans isomerase B (cyclophilin B)